MQVLQKAYALRSKRKLETMRTGLPAPPRAQGPPKRKRMSGEEAVEKRKDAYAKKRNRMHVLGSAHGVGGLMCVRRACRRATISEPALCDWVACDVCIHVCVCDHRHACLLVVLFLVLLWTLCDSVDF